MQDEREAPSNWAQMRDQIDRGATGDKVAAEDPSAAPLGTDAEAGGSGTAAHDIAASARAEQAGMSGDEPTPNSGTGRRAVPAALGIGVLVAVLIAVLVASF